MLVHDGNHFWVLLIVNLEGFHELYELGGGDMFEHAAYFLALALGILKEKSVDATVHLVYDLVLVVHYLP